MKKESQYRSFIASQQAVGNGMLEQIFELATKYKKEGKGTCLKDRHVALIFYEPSTRTRFSFGTAVTNLGGTFSFSENAGEFSSAAKGEKLTHSIRVISAYADAIVLRHTNDDAAKVARNYLESFNISVPIINAGCGKGQHPTQSLQDWFTIREEFGRTDDLRIALCGDNKRGRTARSLAYLFGRERGVHFDLVSAPQLMMEPDILAYFARHGISYAIHRSLDDVIDKVDVVYMTRTQKERPGGVGEISEQDVEACRLTVARVDRMQTHARVMHPMPIVDEIEEAVERMPQAIYFRQSDNGVPVRMALFDLLLGSR